MSLAQLQALVEENESSIHESKATKEFVEGSDVEDQVQVRSKPVTRSGRHAAISDLHIRAAKKGNTVIHTVAAIKPSKKVVREKVEYQGDLDKISKTFHCASFEKHRHRALFESAIDLIQDDTEAVAIDGVEYTLHEIVDILTALTESYEHKDQNKKNARAPKILKMLWYILDAGDSHHVAEFIHVQCVNDNLVTLGDKPKSRTAMFTITILTNYIKSKKGSIGEDVTAEIIQLVDDFQSVFATRIDDIVRLNNSQCKSK